ncbi:fluoride efflux transporter CrcB [Thioalkalivibrio thiocyanodenitrificans]|uniref:fluoride efflux transporter CrcB n=1 Tax=Thioalkalivibrio thiocyanodenitrificans TaxID=243063 RepID=UPI000372B5B6|nr:fluoride efflux transporter CrcB [Thioalkalivibrio thiocyanodenitrificans]
MEGPLPVPGLSPALLAMIALGGFVGGLTRYWLSGVVGRAVGETFPWGTMAVNVSGALCIGVLAALLPPGDGHGLTVSLWAALVVGVLGSYTTVSSFSLQTLALLREGERRRAAANVILSVSLCLGAAAAGHALTLTLLGGGP